MTEQLKSRERLGLTQPEAASRARVSLATWRRWEANPDSVSQATRDKCAKILDREAALRAERRPWDAKFEQAWGDSTILTARQASAIAGALTYWADADIETWLDDPTEEPLHTVGPFAQFDRRVMILVNENRAWAAKAQERCFAVAEEIEAGVLPFDRAGCFFDELLMATVLPDAQNSLSDSPDLYEGIPQRMASSHADDEENDNGWNQLSDDDWEFVEDRFDDGCRFNEYDVPLFNNHPVLAAVLADRHPYTWFDPTVNTDSDLLDHLSRLFPTVASTTGPTDAEAHAPNGSANGSAEPATQKQPPAAGNGAERN